MNLRNKNVGLTLVHFVRWLQNNDLGQKCVVSIRDYLAWTNFINHIVENTSSMSLSNAIVHGGCMAMLDGLGTGSTGGET